MKYRHIIIISIAIFLIAPVRIVFSKEKVIIVIIDGLRYSEGLGDPNHTYVPEMAKLAQEGTIISDFQNDGITYTSRAVPTIWCGTWTEVVDTTYNGKNTQYSKSPSIWEYIRKQKGLPPKKCSYILKYVGSLWLPSFDPDYGPGYWPEFYSSGNTDIAVFENAKTVLEQDQPEFAVIYFADVDHAGHSGNWQNYTNSIEIVDVLVRDLWDLLQNNPFYKGSTSMLVTNDHGRHDDQHGGFKGHGDGCQGCRHIQLLAIGPNIKKNHVSSIQRNLPDVAVTAASILGVNCEKATGNVMEELFISTGIKKTREKLKVMDNYPDPFSSSTKISFELSSASDVGIHIYDMKGALVYSSIKKNQGAGMHFIQWDGTSVHGGMVAPGNYFYNLSSGKERYVGKMTFVGR